MTRLASLPSSHAPPFEDVPLTPEQAELAGIRLRVSGIAARLSRKPERILWACEQLQVELERLRRLRDE